jgi:hypothetical protein
MGRWNDLLKLTVTLKNPYNNLDHWPIKAIEDLIIKYNDLRNLFYQ